MTFIAVLRSITSVFRTVDEHKSSVGQHEAQRAFRRAGHFIYRRYLCGGSLASVKGKAAAVAPENKIRVIAGTNQVKADGILGYNCRINFL